MSFSENICLVIILNLTKTALLHPTSEKRIFGKTTAALPDQIDPQFFLG